MPRDSRRRAFYVDQNSLLQHNNLSTQFVKEGGSVALHDIPAPVLASMVESGQVLRVFVQQNSNWLNIREDDDGIVYSLDLKHVESSLQLFQLDETQISAERSFAELCNENGAIGVCSGQFVRHWLLTT